MMCETEVGSVGCYICLKADLVFLVLYSGRDRVSIDENKTWTLDPMSRTDLESKSAPTRRGKHATAPAKCQDTDATPAWPDLSCRLQRPRPHRWNRWNRWNYNCIQIRLQFFSQLDHLEFGLRIFPREAQFLLRMSLTSCLRVNDIISLSLCITK